MVVIIRTLLSLLLTIAFQSSFSQVIDASICDSTNRLPITKYTYFLRTSEVITIDSVIKSSANFVKSPDKPVLVFEYDQYYYWFRIIVRNQEDKSRQLMLLMAPVGMYEGKLFQKIGTGWKPVAHSGLKYRFEDRSYQFTHHVLPMTLSPKSVDTLYLSIEARNVYKSFGFALIKPKDLKLFENKIYYVFGIIVGLLLLFFILNIASFFALREKLHLWYALYIALLFLIVMKNDHLDQQFLGLDSKRGFRLSPYGAIGALAITILLHVVQSFFKATLSPKKPLYRISTILKMNALCSAIVHAFVLAMEYDNRIQGVIFSWVKISILLCICMVLVNCIYCIMKGFKSAWFIFIGSLVFMIGSLQRLFFPSTLSFLFPPTTFHIGIILETIVISIGLISRYWYREQQIHIQVMNDISAELHDNITPSLTTAAIYLKSKHDDQYANKIDDAIKLIGKANKELRDFSRTLRDDAPPRTDLIEQIKAECKSVANIGAFSLEFTKSGHSIELEKKKQAMIIRIVKEVLQNAVKHSKASNVKVSIAFTERLMALKIQDNGTGFDISRANQNSNGLKNIQNRAFLLNATCHIESREGHGTEILIKMPL